MKTDEKHQSSSSCHNYSISSLERSVNSTILKEREKNSLHMKMRRLFFGKKWWFLFSLNHDLAAIADIHTRLRRFAIETKTVKGVPLGLLGTGSGERACYACSLVAEGR